MSIAEAALYGDLVQYLRDRWAEQAAEFNESAIDDERSRIDELIRSWFFAPQSELHGLTPREIIRNEELDRPNIVPHDQLDELFDDGCPICQLARAEALNGEEDSGWHFGLAPDHTLLDEYDPASYAAHWAGVDREIEVRQANQNKPEAREWLAKKSEPACFWMNTEGR